jgi:hypothetical protein
MRKSVRPDAPGSNLMQPARWQTSELCRRLPNHDAMRLARAVEGRCSVKTWSLRTIDHLAAEVGDFLVHFINPTGSLCNVPRPSGVSVLIKMYFVICVLLPG